MFRLFKDGTAKLCIGVISEINPLIHKPLAFCIQHYPQKITYFAVVFTLFRLDIQIAKIFHMQIHWGSVTAIIFTITLCAKLIGHLQPVTCIMWCAANLSMPPVCTKFSLSQLVTCLKPPTGKDNGISLNFLITHQNTGNPALRGHQACYSCIKTDSTTQLFKCCSFHIIQPNTLIQRCQCQTAPENDFPIFLKTLT